MANRKLIKAAALLLVAAVLVQQASARSWQEDFDAADDNEGPRRMLKKSNNNNSNKCNTSELDKDLMAYLQITSIPDSMRGLKVKCAGRENLGEVAINCLPNNKWDKSSLKSAARACCMLANPPPVYGGVGKNCPKDD